MKTNDSTSTYSVIIYNGLNPIVRNDKFTDKNEAINSAKRIIESQKKIDPSFSSYAMVWDGKRMLAYFD